MVAIMHINSDTQTATAVESIDDIDHFTDDMTATNYNTHNLPKKLVRHRAMSAQQQIDRIDELEQVLKAHGGPTTPLPMRKNKKRKSSTPEPEIETINAERVVFNNATPPAEVPEKKSIAARETQSVPKSKIPNKRAQSWTRSDLPRKTVQLMKTLNQFGVPFEKVLSGAIQDAQDELGRMPGTETLTKELQAMGREWKIANRASLHKVETLLSRNGIVAIGGVEIPGALL